jgi:hypothetical protein
MGSGLFDWLKNAANWVKDKVVDTPFYQQTVRPIAKQGVSNLIDTFVPVVARDVAHKAADFAGDKTGAFGLRKPKLSNNMSRMIGPEHPAFSPGLPLRPIGGEVSFKAKNDCLQSSNASNMPKAPKKQVRRRRSNGTSSGSFLPA